MDNASLNPLFRHSTIPTQLSIPLDRLITLPHSPDLPILPNNDDVVLLNDDNVNCFYSKPMVMLDMTWNMAFVVVSLIVLLSTLNERPCIPLRVWVCGYALQCVLHVGFVQFDYQWSCFEDAGIHLCHHCSTLKRLESINIMVSSLWWVLGFYWIVAGGQALLQDSPRLYWLTVVFLAFDVFFVILCVGLACIIFLALFCCIPIVAIAYTLATKEGATEDDIRRLPKHRYHRASPSGTLDYDVNQVFWTKLETRKNSSSDELALIIEDSVSTQECCICLSQYVDGVELCSLPCNHHFHSRCISKWLRINATCPLCKSDIRRGDMLV